jgi:Uma2 family endonuclease
MIQKSKKTGFISGSGPHSFEDFCWIVKDGQKSDLLEGTIFMASPDNTYADELFGWVRAVSSIFVRRRKLGRIAGSRVAFRLDDFNGPEPDIAFVKMSRIQLIMRGYVDGRPDLAMEIVSPDSILRDYKHKRTIYENAGIEEYWIIDQIKKKVTLLRLDGRGKYREVPPVKGCLHSKVIEGFWLKISWLWMDPLPDEIETLAIIMGTNKQ